MKPHKIPCLTSAVEYVLQNKQKRVLERLKAWTLVIHKLPERSNHELKASIVESLRH